MSISEKQRLHLEKLHTLRRERKEYWTDEQKIKISGINSPNWKGGKYKRNGYVFRYKPEHPFPNDCKKYVAEHRLVMEEKIGRYLTKDEMVHHLNGIRDDNRIENLQLLLKNQHHCGHTIICPHCGKDYYEK